MTEQEQIDRYCARRDAAPLDWELEDDGPVFDKGDFANDVGTATYATEEDMLWLR